MIVKFKCSKVLQNKLNYLDFEDFEKNNMVILKQLYDLIENSVECAEFEDGF
jgi:hypothetical protein